MKHYSEILVRPWITERAMEDAEKTNTYPFEVRPDANKIQIRKAIETRYDVTVIRVRTMVVPGKPRRFRRAVTTSTRPRKKALVQLKEGDSIDLL
jgi:large subunit ribosomal protein L23